MDPGLTLSSVRSTPMSLFNVQPGDLVFAAPAIHNDGSIPTQEDNALLAVPGARDVPHLNGPCSATIAHK